MRASHTAECTHISFSPLPPPPPPPPPRGISVGRFPKVHERARLTLMRWEVVEHALGRRTSNPWQDVGVFVKFNSRYRRAFDV